MKSKRIILILLVLVCGALLRAQGDLNVKTYGAYGDGNHSDYAAINSAIAQINSSPYGGNLYFPKGNYLLGGNLNQITKPCSIVGDGVGATTIMSDGRNGFVFNYSGGAAHLAATVRDMSINSNGQPGFVGIEYIPGISGTDVNLCFSFLRLSMSGWGTAIYVNSGALNRVQHGTIDNVQILGNPGTRSNAVYGIRIKNATCVGMSHVSATWVRYGVYVEGDGEGDSITESNFAAVENGIVFGGTGSYRSNFQVSHVFVECTTSGIAITNGGPFSAIESNSISNGSGGATGISVNGSRTVVMNNTFWGGNWNKTIEVAGGDAVLVQGNVIDTKGIVLAAGTSNCLVKGNTFTNVAGDLVIDAGSENAVGDTRGFSGIVGIPAYTMTSEYAFDIDVRGCALGKKPPGVAVTNLSSADIFMRYDYDSPATSKTSIRCRFFRPSSGAALNPSGGTVYYRYSVVVGP